MPGVYYLRHVGFLGAQPPSSQGLRPIELAEDEEGVVEFGDFGDSVSAGVFRRLREWLIDKFSQEDADRVVPGWDVDNLLAESRREVDSPAFTEPTPSNKPTTEEHPVNPAEKAALEAENTRLKTQLAAHQEREQKEQAAQRHTKNLAFAEGLVGAGKLLPKHTAALIAALTSPRQVMHRWSSAKAINASRLSTASRQSSTTCRNRSTSRSKRASTARAICMSQAIWSSPRRTPTPTASACTTVQLPWPPTKTSLTSRRFANSSSNKESSWLIV